METSSDSAHIKNAGKRVYLTVELDANDPAFDSVAGAQRINSWEVLEKFDYDMMQDLAKKADFLATGIKDAAGNILVGKAGYNLDDLIAIGQQLEKRQLKIDTIFLPSGERRANKLAEGKLMYDQHNRWLDFYPGEIEDIWAAFEKTVGEIKSYYSGKETAVVEI